jgi:acyl carrier protein
MYEDIVYKIINEHITQNEITPAQVADNLQLLGMDSITFIRIIVAFEEALEIEIPDNYLLMNEMNSVEKMLGVINSLKTS